jgi:hypothetical protein
VLNLLMLAGHLSQHPLKDWQRPALTSMQLNG